MNSKEVLMELAALEATVEMSVRLAKRRQRVNVDDLLFGLDAVEDKCQQIRELAAGDEEDDETTPAAPTQLPLGDGGGGGSRISPSSASAP